MHLTLSRSQLMAFALLVTVLAAALLLASFDGPGSALAAPQHDPCVTGTAQFLITDTPAPCESATVTTTQPAFVRSPASNQPSAPRFINPVQYRNQIAFRRTIGGAQNIYTMNVDGAYIQQMTDFGNCLPEDCQPTWSPDGQFIAFIYLGLDAIKHLVVVNSGDTNWNWSVPLGFYYGKASYPSWSPNGLHIVRTRFDSSLITNHFTIQVDDLLGQCSSQVLYTGPNGGDGAINGTSWSPDGYHIVFI